MGAVLGLFLWGYIAIVACVLFLVLALSGIAILYHVFRTLFSWRTPAGIRQPRGIATEYRSVVVLASDGRRRLRAFESEIPDITTIGRN